MWCPEGYVTLYSIVQEFNLVSVEVNPAVDRPKSAAEGFVIDTGLPDEVESVAYLKWLLRIFFREFSDKVRVCLGSGILVVPDWPVTHFIPPRGDESDDYSPFPESYHKRELISKVQFIGFEMRVGCLVKRNPLLDFDLSPIAGCPLCIGLKHIPVELKDLPSWLEEAAGKRLRERRDEIAKGTPAARKVMEELLQEFPNGKKNTSWKLVMDRSGYDRRTIVRHVKATGNHWWLLGGGQE